MDNEIAKTSINTSEKLWTPIVNATQGSMYPAIHVPRYLCWHPRELFRFNMIYGDQPIFKCWSVSTSLSLKGVNII